MYILQDAKAELLLIFFIITKSSLKEGGCLLHHNKAQECYLGIQKNIELLACHTRGDCVIPGGSSALSGSSGFSFQHQLWLPLL